MKRTEEEKQTWKDKMRGLAATIKAMSEVQRAELAAQFPIVTCEGHVLSTWNQCALITQGQLSGIMPTQVAGFRQWKKIDRQVRKGQHACGYIMVPMGKGKKAAEPEVDDSGEQKKGSIRFKWVPMFDVTQTETVGVAKEVEKPVNPVLDMVKAKSEPLNDWQPPTIWDTDEPEPGKQYLITAPPKEPQTIKPDFKKPKQLPAPVIDAEVVKPSQGLLFG